MKVNFDLHEYLMTWKSVLCMLPSVCLLLQFSKVFGMVSHSVNISVLLFVNYLPEYAIFIWPIDTCADQLHSVALYAVPFHRHERGFPTSLCERGRQS
jgi:hypothetical protein